MSYDNSNHDFAVLFKHAVKSTYKKNIRAFKSYWPLFLLIQIPLLFLYALFVQQRVISEGSLNSYQNNSLIQQKIQEQQALSIRNVEQLFTDLNQKVEKLQAQNEKLSKILSALKTFHKKQISEPIVPNTSLIQKITLESLDKIGEKIRLSEPYSSLINSLPSDCTKFSGYKTLQQFSARPPMSTYQLKKSLENMAKNYNPQGSPTNPPVWLDKLASIFRGNIKIEKIEPQKESPFQPILIALETHDIKSAHTLAKESQIQAIKEWAKMVEDHLLVEEEYGVFVEEIKLWIRGQYQANETPPKKQENLL